jgi:DNA-directed RNA polymerase, mitochondrial
MYYPGDIFERFFDNKEGYFKNELARLVINPTHFEDIKNNIIVEPASLPMICEPNKWSDDFCGGYLDNELREEGIISGSLYHGHEMFNKNKLYETINYMSSIKFKINEDLLNYLENEGNYLIEEKEDKSEELQKLTTLQIAKTYINTPFYLPLQADWRGRIYTKPFFITYQGNDLSLSLLEFWEGEVLTPSGLDSLYIYGANNYNQSNISKDTYSNRIKWVKDNINNILKMDKEFILKAENKIIFIVFCLIIRQLQKDTNYKVKLPVFLDATCSGIQHLAAIMRDFKLASEVNLITPNDSKGVSDIYNKLRIPINEEIRKYGKENPKYSILELVDLKRSDLKLPIMTKTYNVTQLGIKNQLASILTKTKSGRSVIYHAPSIIKNKFIELSNIELLKIAEIINKTIFKEYPSLYIIYSYFIDMAKLMNKLELPIIWFTPSGLEITQKYYTA